MEMKLKIYNSPEKIAIKLSEELNKVLNEKDKRFCIALSGGNTPRIWFNTLAQLPFKDSIPWYKVEVYWVDERCVPPNDTDSNFGMTEKILLSKVSIPEGNIHRIRGESDPVAEAERYSMEISNATTSRLKKDESGFPVFDWIILGLGKDGHTASLFPGEKLHNVVKNICGVAIHPESRQKRISFTERIINNADRVSFLVAGKGKAKVLSKIIKNTSTGKKYPASNINPSKGILEWIVDKEAASLL